MDAVAIAGVVLWTTVFTALGHCHRRRMHTLYLYPNEFPAYFPRILSTNDRVRHFWVPVSSDKMSDESQ